MALKPRIYKAKISLADIELNHYENLSLTLAQHPSETLERMMARVLAYCMNAGKSLRFTKGLSSVEEPDIWARTLDNQISLWIDIGEPSYDRIKKACRLSQAVKVYSFNLKSDNWWAKEQEKYKDLRASVFQFHWKGIQALAGLVKRTMDLSVTASDGLLYVSSENGTCEVAWTELQSNEPS
ncbi:YaeQ family protein [Desulfospira joergensenii]|uniref:YaeQ family protein n=1 Tax=Desulfospira joergensenii TaxID=53329 RepID=UPI0003B65C23|nr:YaeQ family protein [Desulfospira joergensenii]